MQVAPLPPPRPHGPRRRRVANLAGMPELELLTVVGTRITDAGVENLCRLKRLFTLYVSDTAFTPAALERLPALLTARIELESPR